jgi:hypothetical protein
LSNILPLFSGPKSKPTNKPKEVNDKLALFLITEDGGNIPSKPQALSELHGTTTEHTHIQQ